MSDPEPLAALLRLHGEATAAGDPAADTMALATATPDGRPSLRYVSFRGLSDGDGARGLRFFTNLDSRKAGELDANPRAAGLFLWASLGVQARVEGPVAPLDDAACDAYFAARPRGHQLAAWASPQSRPLAHAALLEAYAACERRFAGVAVPRPPGGAGSPCSRDGSSSSGAAKAASTGASRTAPKGPPGAAPRSARRRGAGFRIALRRAARSARCCSCLPSPRSVERERVRGLPRELRRRNAGGPLTLALSPADRGEGTGAASAPRLGLPGRGDRSCRNPVRR